MNFLWKTPDKRLFWAGERLAASSLIFIHFTPNCYWRIKRFKPLLQQLVCPVQSLLLNRYTPNTTPPTFNKYRDSAASQKPTTTYNIRSSQNCSELKVSHRSQLRIFQNLKWDERRGRTLARTGAAAPCDLCDSEGTQSFWSLQRHK